MTSVHFAATSLYSGFLFILVKGIKLRALSAHIPLWRAPVTIASAMEGVGKGLNLCLGCATDYEDGVVCVVIEFELMVQASVT